MNRHQVASSAGKGKRKKVSLMDQQATSKRRSTMTGLQSVQSLGWGAVAMHELPQLINWSGSDSFKPAKIDPWTALIATSGPAPANSDGSAASPSAAPVTESTSPASHEAVSTEKVVAAAEAEQAALEKAALEKAALRKQL